MYSARATLRDGKATANAQAGQTRSLFNTTMILPSLSVMLRLENLGNTGQF